MYIYEICQSSSLLSLLHSLTRVTGWLILLHSFWSGSIDIMRSCAVGGRRGTLEELLLSTAVSH